MWVSLSSAIVVAMATCTVNRACFAGLGLTLQLRRACKALAKERVNALERTQKSLLLPGLNKQDDLTAVPHGVEAKGGVRGPPPPPGLDKRHMQAQTTTAAITTTTTNPLHTLLPHHAPFMVLPIHM